MFDRHFEKFGALKISKIAYRRTLTHPKAKSWKISLRKLQRMAGGVYSYTLDPAWRHWTFCWTGRETSRCLVT